VEVIHALSPQAKGRAERIFGVLQDRLVNEMRVKGIYKYDISKLTGQWPCGGV
jgi:hypothetical protein